MLLFIYICHYCTPLPDKLSAEDRSLNTVKMEIGSFYCCKMESDSNKKMACLLGYLHCQYEEKNSDCKHYEKDSSMVKM